MTQQYFQTYEDYFWEFDNQVNRADCVFESLAVPGGKTIVYETFLRETLEWLSDESLPPLGSILLVLAATNPDSEACLSTIFERLRKASANAKFRFVEELLANSFSLLRLLSQLPDNFRKGNNRQQLLRLLFQNAHNRLGAQKAKTMLAELRQQPFLLLKAAEKMPFDVQVMSHDLGVFQTLGRRFQDVASIEKAFLDLPDIEKPELPEAEAKDDAPKTLLQQLLEDPVAFHVASLIPRLWSGFHVKMHHGNPSERPLGGVSDLTNKGDFDRLLLSEFANEDEVFLNRIANNEALFIKREVPPEGEKLVRILLVDASIRTWGVPKVLAFASALAIATHPKTDIECQIKIVGGDVLDLDHQSKDDIVDKLKSPDVSLAPVSGLQAFASAFDKKKKHEVFLFTSADTLRLPQMAKLLSESDYLNYLSVSDAHGQIDFFQIRNRLRQFLQRISLPLEELWAGAPTGKQREKADTKVEDGIFPILGPLPRNLMAHFEIGDYRYLLASNRSLHRVPMGNPKSVLLSKGSKVIFENLSVKAGLEYELTIDEGGNFLLYLLDVKLAEIAVLNLANRKYAALKCSGFDKIGKLFGEVCISKKPENPQQSRAVTAAVVVDANHKISLSNRPDAGGLTGSGAKQQLHLPGSSVLKNLNSCGINKNGNLQLSKYELIFDINGHPILRGNRNAGLESKAIYAKRQFTFADGSRISVSKRGILTLMGSDPDGPRIYLPLSINHTLALATDDYFSGNEYYYDTDSALTRMDTAVFKSKFLDKFLQHILEHAAQHPSE